MLPIPPLALALCAAAPLITPPQAAPAPERHVLRGVRLGLSEEAPVRTLVLEGGRIVQVLEADAEEPRAARVVEGQGLLAVPAFIDAYSRAGCETPLPDPDQDVPVPMAAGPRVDMRLAGRKGVQPAFRAVDVFAMEEKDSANWRESGFGALLSSPGGELLAGTSVLASTREAARRERVLAADVFAHAALRAKGRGYPSTLMGYLAQLRQVFLDAQRHAELQARYDQGKPGQRPPYDADLEALLPVLAGQEHLAVAANDAGDIDLWMGLAEEYGFELLVTGGREAWRVADSLARREVPVVLTLEWGEEVDDPSPDDEEDEDGEEQEAASEEVEEASEEEEAEAAPNDVYSEPLGVREERRRIWEETRDGALRLHAAGVTFAFGSADGSPKKLLEKVRTLVAEGLDTEVALAGLTATPAELLGVRAHLGSLAVGRDATLALWTGSPFDEDAELAWLFVDGFVHEYEVGQDDGDTAPPDEGVDATGTWKIVIDGQMGARDGALVLEMAEDGSTTGSLSSEGPDGSSSEADVEGRVSGSSLTLKGQFEVDGMQIKTTITVELDGDSMSGESVSKMSFGEFESTLTGTRDPRSTEEVR